jgi:hypothetical protein
MESDLDYNQRLMVPSEFEDEEDGCDDYSLEEGWPDEDEEVAE